MRREYVRHVSNSFGIVDCQTFSMMLRMVVCMKNLNISFQVRQEQFSSVTRRWMRLEINLHLKRPPKKP